MQHIFYDTCALLDQSKVLLQNNEHFFISSITLKELENIKSSSTKDQDVKYKARKVIELLAKHENDFQVIVYQKTWDDLLKNYPVLSDNNDSRIILSALQFKQLHPNDEVLFITQDYFCKRIAASLGLTVDYMTSEESNYKGWIEVSAPTDEALSELYNLIYSFKDNNPFGLKYNQYLLLKDKDGKVIDHYKYNGQTYNRIPDFYIFESKQFGKIKPKDPYQLIAMDSLIKNQISLLRGPAGSGKSYLALGYLFSQVEKGNLDKIIIFCNTVAANGAAKLGFYPGSKDDKLLDSQIGNFLSSKLGDKTEVERLIDQGLIVLLPLADARGYDTTGMKAGIYITEAQNMDIELIKLALQRVGEDCIVILDGDSEAQVDLSLYAGANNGLRRVSTVFRGEEIYGEVTLPNIYRSKIANIAQRL